MSSLALNLAGYPEPNFLLFVFHKSFRLLKGEGIVCCSIRDFLLVVLVKSTSCLSVSNPRSSQPRETGALCLSVPTMSFPTLPSMIASATW